MKVRINGNIYNLKKKDFLIQLAFWNSARKSDDLFYGKHKWTYYEKLKSFENRCVFCETFIIDGYGCADCPLKSCWGNSTFEKWAWPLKYRKTEKAQLKLKKQAAEKIYQVTKKFLIKHWGMFQLLQFFSF
jgi:hypothetical protein